MGFRGTGEVSPTFASVVLVEGVVADCADAIGGVSGGAGDATESGAGESCDLTGPETISAPSLSGRFFFVEAFDPASSASMNSELSCSSAT